MFVELILALTLITNFEAISFESLIFEVYGGNERSNFNVSLMDLFHLLNDHGYYSAGFKMTYEELAQAVEKYYPLVIHLEEGNGHFLLVLGILDDVVVIMGPAEGVRTIHRNELEATWSNVVLLVGSNTKRLNTEKVKSVIEDAMQKRNFIEESNFL